MNQKKGLGVTDGKGLFPFARKECWKRGLQRNYKLSGEENKCWEGGAILEIEKRREEVAQVVKKTIEKADESRPPQKSTKGGTGDLFR